MTGDAKPAIDAAVLPVDPCPAVPPACPTLPGGYARGDGMRTIDRCAFPLTDRDTWAARAAIIAAFPTALPHVSLADITADLNRSATRVTTVPGSPPGLAHAFKWEAGDESVAYWIPQGITGSWDRGGEATVAGRKLALVSWYYDMASEPGSTVDKGVRIAITDVTNPAAVAYRFALLVDPVMRNGHPDFDPVKVHAGGIAWVGDYLYVPQTGTGFRVFDLSNIMQVASVEDRLGLDATSGTYAAHGYRYVIPQIATYDETGACNAVFSFVSVDHSTPTPTLISGEYDSTSIGGRLYRWPLDPGTHRLQLTDANRVIADGAWFEGESHVQGGAARGDTFWLSSSFPAGGAGALYRTRVDQPSTQLRWSDAPEDLAWDPAADELWSISEATNARYVFASSGAAVRP